jgi:hypothetical protein
MRKRVIIPYWRAKKVKAYEDAVRAAGWSRNLFSQAAHCLWTGLRGWY